MLAFHNSTKHFGQRRATKRDERKDFFLCYNYILVDRSSSTILFIYENGRKRKRRKKPITTCRSCRSCLFMAERTDISSSHHPLRSSGLVTLRFTTAIHEIFSEFRRKCPFLKRYCVCRPHLAILADGCRQKLLVFCSSTAKHPDGV